MASVKGLQGQFDIQLISGCHRVEVSVGRPAKVEMFLSTPSPCDYDKRTSWGIAKAEKILQEIKANRSLSFVAEGYDVIVSCAKELEQLRDQLNRCIDASRTIRLSIAYPQTLLTRRQLRNGDVYPTWPLRYRAKMVNQTRESKDGSLLEVVQYDFSYGSDNHLQPIQQAVEFTRRHFSELVGCEGNVYLRLQSKDRDLHEETIGIARLVDA